MALGLVYVVVVPQLQNRLIDQKIAQLESVANDQDAPAADLGRRHGGGRLRDPRRRRW